MTLAWEEHILAIGLIEACKNQLIGRRPYPPLLFRKGLGRSLFGSLCLLGALLDCIGFLVN